MKILAKKLNDGVLVWQAILPFNAYLNISLNIYTCVQMN